MKQRGIESSLVLHSGGVTKRTAELREYWPNQRIIELQDFNEHILTNIPNSEVILGRISLRKPFRFAVEKSGLIASCNTDREFKNLKPYIRQIRGHYSYRFISPSTIEDMDNLLTNKTKALISRTEMPPVDISVHLRLGDLLTLKTKNPLSQKRVSGAINQVYSFSNKRKILFSSDSPVVASHMLSVFDDVESLPKHGDAFNAITQLQTAMFFVGTNSKLSVWITLIRLYFQQNKMSWLPEEIRQHLNTNVDRTLLERFVRFY